MEKILYHEALLEVRRGAWLDVMNSWLYSEEDTIKTPEGAFRICREREVDGGGLFALPAYRKSK